MQNENYTGTVLVVLLSARQIGCRTSTAKSSLLKMSKYTFYARFIECLPEIINAAYPEH
jgi:hypothetical protein